MRRIIRSRLPERLKSAVPPLVTEVGIGVFVPAALFAFRYFAVPWTGSQAPFALAFLGVVVACLLAGWRSGLIALLIGQGLSWYFLLPVVNSFELADRASFFALLVATVSELGILLVLSLYQREVAASVTRRQRQIDFLGQALREIDHRTQNNFQIVLSIVELQANRSASPEIRTALIEARDRIRAVSRVYDKLALRSAGLEMIRLEDHIGDLCEQLSLSLLPETVALRSQLAVANVRVDDAINLGIIVNELITNAVKHAFGPEGGTIEVRTVIEGGILELCVADDGRGMPPAHERRSGTGSRLIEAFVRHLGGEHVVEVEAGTTHRIRVPYGAPDSGRKG